MLFLSQLITFNILLKILWKKVVIRIGKVSDGWIKDLGFNFHLYQKLIGVLV